MSDFSANRGDSNERNRNSRGNATRGSSAERSNSESRKGRRDAEERTKDLEMSIGRELSRFRDGWSDNSSSTERRGDDDKDLFGRDRYYNRDRGWSRDNDRERDRGRDRDYRDRDRSRSRDRERERERDRGRDNFGRDRNWDDNGRDFDRRGSKDDLYYDEDNDHRRDRDNGHDRDHYRSSRDRDDRDGRTRHRQERRTMEDPTNIIMLRGLPESITKDDIVEELQARRTVFKDLRVVRSNKGGFSRGFCFLEFPTLSEAQEWMDEMRGYFMVKDISLGLDYSRPRNKSVTGPPATEVKEKDWNCTMCGMQNFHSKKRSTCFGCGGPKPEDEEEESEKDKEVGKSPCKVLIIKGLDVITTEDKIKQALVEITALPIYDVRLIKDKLTHTSRGFCFVELESIQAASQLLEVIANMIPAMTIDGKVITASYAIQNSSNSSNKPGGNTGGNRSRNQASGSAAANAIAQAQAAASMGTAPAYQQQYQQAAAATQVQAPGVSGQTSTDAAQVQPNQTGQDANAEYQKQALQYQQQGQQAPGSNYVYDPNSGYHYDATTGLYYDPNTQYHYNSVTGQFLLWNAATQQYVPVAAEWAGTAVTSSTGATTAAAATTSTAGTVTADTTTAAADSTTAKEKQKKAKSLQAKKIAKDMERWAKGMNAAKSKSVSTPVASKEEETAGNKEPEFKMPLPVATATKAPIRQNVVQGFASMPAMPERVESSPLAALSSLKGSTGEGPALGSIVAEYGGDDSDPEEDTNEKFTDLKLMACLLCKRQFPNKEGLERHQQFSDLHKQNLDIHKKMSMNEEELEEYEKQERQLKYRDRAKERRTKYKQPEPAVSNFAVSRKRRREPAMPVYEQPTRDGIGGDNIGNQMLKAMGWTEGSGLGKSGQGIVNPIEAKIRTQHAGLGVRGSNYGATAADTYKKKVKKMAMSRFHDE